MDALKFVKERNRMCKSFGRSCDGCPANKNTCCDAFEWQERLVPIVEKWSKENPRKTRQSVFIQQNPEVVLTDGVINIKPCQMVKYYTYKDCHLTKCQCMECCKEYWLQEVE